MKFLNKFLKKEEIEEEFVNIDDEGNEIETSIQEITYSNDKISIKELIESLNLEEVYEVKDLIEKRLKKLHKEYGLEDEPKKAVKEEIIEKKEIKSEPKIIQEKKIEIEPEVIEKEDENYLEFGEETKTIDEETVEEIEKKVEEEEIVDKLKAYFGENNVFFETRNDMQDKALKGKEVYCIGIRAKEAFNDDSFDILKQNSWFIRTIKKLDELKNFKMITSSNVEKKLVWDKGDYAILICYKASTILKNPIEFNFN